MAMLNVIVTEDLYDHDFVDCWTYGFELLAERVAGAHHILNLPLVLPGEHAAIRDLRRQR